MPFKGFNMLECKCFFSEAVEQLSLIHFVTFLRLVAVRVIEPSECTLSLQNPYTEEKI